MPCAEGFGSTHGAQSCTSLRQTAVMGAGGRGNRCSEVTAVGACAGRFSFVSSSKDKQVWRGSCRRQHMLLLRLAKFGMWAIGKTSNAFSFVAVSRNPLPDSVPKHAWTRVHGGGNAALVLTCTSGIKPTTVLPSTAAPTTVPTAVSTSKPTIKRHFEPPDEEALWHAWRHSTKRPTNAPTTMPTAAPTPVVVPDHVDKFIAAPRAAAHSDRSAGVPGAAVGTRHQAPSQEHTRGALHALPPKPTQVDWTLCGAVAFVLAFMCGALRGGVWDGSKAGSLLNAPAAEEAAGITRTCSTGGFKHSYGYEYGDDRGEENLKSFSMLDIFN